MSVLTITDLAVLGANIRERLTGFAVNCMQVRRREVQSFHGTLRGCMKVSREVTFIEMATMFRVSSEFSYIVFLKRVSVNTTCS